MLAAQMHAGDVDVTFAKYRSDTADDTRLIVIGEEDHIAVRDHLERVPIDVYDARKLVRENSPRYAMRFNIGFQLDDDEVREIFRCRNAGLLNPDATLFSDMHRVDQVYTFAQHGHEQASDDDGGEVIQVHIGYFAGISNGYRLHAPVAKLRDETRQAGCEIDKVPIALDGPCFEPREIQRSIHGILQKKIRHLPANIFGDLSLRFYRGSAEVRGRDEIVEFQKRRFRIGFRFEDVECRSCDFPAL